MDGTNKAYRHAKRGLMIGRIVRDDLKFMDFIFSEEQAIGDGEGGVELYEPSEFITLKSGSLKEVKQYDKSK